MDVPPQVILYHGDNGGDFKEVKTVLIQNAEKRRSSVANNEEFTFLSS
jgi:hypothetical protein